VPLWYFAYGSNMQSATLRGRRGIDFQRALPARAAGWRLVFDKPPLVPIGQSFANIIAEAGAEVLGVVFEVSEANLRQIDLTEGVLVGNYQRVEVAVTPLTAPSSATLTAFTLTSDHRDPALQPSHRYMELLIAGAREHGLPAEYIAFLRSIPALPETAEAIEFRAHLDDALRRLR
jgi:cation transport regulator ChaC